MTATRAMTVALALALAGCAAGPDFKRPSSPDAERYTAQALPQQTDSAAVAGGAAQRLTAGQTVQAEWWTLFGSDSLNQLVAAALRANPDLQAAEAALRVAQESAAAQHGALWPSVDLQLQPTRQRVADPLSSPTASGTNLYSLHTAQLNIAYVPDVFGGTRRQVEAADAQTDVARFQRHAAWLTLTSNVVLAAIQQASLQDQVQATRELITLSRDQLDLAGQQQRAGQSGALEVAAQETALAQLEATLPGLEKQLAQQQHALAVLTGRMPGTELPALQLKELALPQDLPVSLPAQLVEQRPDIRAAEAQLHAASAQIGVATAARLPNITLTAAFGSSALTPGTLFSTGTGFWSIGANLVQPVFQGGALMHQQKAAEAAYDQAAAQYRATVLTGFQNVADTLSALHADARGLRAAVTAEQAAGKSLRIAQKQHQVGMSGRPAVLLAQQAYQQSVLALVQAQAARYADTVALYQSLGGGWWLEARSGAQQAKAE